MSMGLAYTKEAKICGRFQSKAPAKISNTPPLRGGRAAVYNSLRSFSQLGRGRILMPDTSPMAMNSVRVDEPP